MDILEAIGVLNHSQTEDITPYDIYGKYYVPLTEANMNRIVNGHDAFGYIMISASRADKSEEENNIRKKSIVKDIKSLGYSYVPVFGGYKEDGQDRASLEKSFIVYPYNIQTKEYADFDDFKRDMINLGKKYNQDSVLVKDGKNNPIYIQCSTETPYDDNDEGFSGVKYNHTDSEYFTALKKWSDMSKNGKNRDWKNGSLQRFTFEAYIDEQPNQVMSGHARTSLNEFVVPGFRGL